MVFWQRAIEATGEPLLGLDVARQITPMTFHALGYAGLASQNLAELFTRLSRYFRVVSDAGELRFERVGRAGRLRMSGDARLVGQADAQHIGLHAGDPAGLRHPVRPWLSRAGVAPAAASAG